MPEDPLKLIGRAVGPVGMNVPNVGTPPVLQIDPLANQVPQGPGVGKITNMTTLMKVVPKGNPATQPGLARRYQQRIKNADSDEALWEIVKDAWKNFGVDWSHLIAGSKYDK